MATEESATTLASWREGPARSGILAFVAAVTGADGSLPVPEAERNAVLDNDGTLWCEQPMPIQLDFILRRLVEMADADESLRTRQPWLAAYERDYMWLSGLMAEHYAGDDTNVRVLASGILTAFDGMSVEDFEARADQFPAQCATPNARSRLPRLRLHADGGVADLPGGHGFTNDGPEKPIRIWSRIGRRPLLAGGNSNGDIPMLNFAHQGDKPFMRLLVHHDHDAREFSYDTGAEQALERAAANDWTVISVKDGWATVF